MKTKQKLKPTKQAIIKPDTRPSPDAFNKRRPSKAGQYKWLLQRLKNTVRVQAPEVYAAHKDAIYLADDYHQVKQLVGPDAVEDALEQLFNVVRN